MSECGVSDSSYHFRNRISSNTGRRKGYNLIIFNKTTLVRRCKFTIKLLQSRTIDEYIRPNLCYTFRNSNTLKSCTAIECISINNSYTRWDNNTLERCAISKYVTSDCCQLAIGNNSADTVAVCITLDYPIWHIYRIGVCCCVEYGCGICGIKGLAI